MKAKISFHLSILFLVIGATKQFDLTLIARVPLSEIIAFGSLPFLLRSLPNKQGVTLIECSFVEKFAQKLARSVPRVFKTSNNKSVWTAFMSIFRYLKIRHHVLYPNEFEVEEIRRRCSSTVTL